MQINIVLSLEDHWVVASASKYGSSVVCPVVSEWNDSIWFGGH